jgi:lipopolysaccharide/colanic/teichoic acid biosynthesis glycosyltransferase
VTGETLKRVFDVVASSIATIVLVLVFIAIALAVKLDSPGPILYRQTRVGRNGAPFTMIKFRSMVHGADRMAANVSPASDPRVSRVGAVLRAWHLDELPQLINVIRGDMSIVGPRPETPEFVERYRPDELRVLSVRPGLVSPSTLAFMDEAEILAASDDPHAYYVTTVLHERVRLDLEYIDHASFGGDLSLLLAQAAAIWRYT